MRSLLIVSGPVYCTSIELILIPLLCACARGETKRASSNATKIDDAGLRDRPVKLFIKENDDGQNGPCPDAGVLVRGDDEIVKGNCSCEALCIPERNSANYQR